MGYILVLELIGLVEELEARRGKSRLLIGLDGSEKQCLRHLRVAVKTVGSEFTTQGEDYTNRNITIISKPVTSEVMEVYDYHLERGSRENKRRPGSET